jgi:DNA-binding NarL/FixJ family response regulator
MSGEAAATLTPREREVVRLAWEGMSDRAIGARLGLSRHTVKGYWVRIHDRLGTRQQGSSPRTLAAVMLWQHERRHAREAA